MDLTVRSRRLRGSEALRKIVRETRVDKSALIYPLFVMDGENRVEEIPSMPGQYRYTVDRVDEELDKLTEAGVRSILLFGIPEHKDEIGSSAWAEDGAVQRALRKARRSIPTSSSLRMSACANTPPMATAACSAAGRWKTTRLWSCWQRKPSPMCGPGRTWWPLPT